MVKRHNQKEIDEKNKRRLEDSKRYLFERGEFNGQPTLKITDRYLAPHIVNVYDFSFNGLPEQYGYGALMVEKLCTMLNRINERMPTPADQMGHTLR